MEFWKKKPKPTDFGPLSDDPYSLDYPLFMVSDLDAVTTRMACTGVKIFGGVGSGKSSGSFATIVRSYLRAGMGGLVLCVKPGERAQFEKWAQQTGRSNDLIVVSPAGPWRCNLLHLALNRPGVQGSRVDQVVNLIMTLGEIAERGEKGGGKNEKFFEVSCRQLVRNAVEICVAARGTVTAPLLQKLIASAPRSEAQIHDSNWQKNSLCFQLITEGDAKPKSEEEEHDFAMAASYFLQEFAEMPYDTRGSVLATYGSLADPLMRGQMLTLFGGETNFLPDHSFYGKVIILDMPIKVYGQAGLMLQAAFKYLWQQAAEQRDVKANPRFTFFACDEFHAAMTEGDGDFFSTCRSVGICSLVVSQNLSNYYAVMGEAGRHRVDAMLANLGLTVLHANNDHITNKWASDMIAKSWQVKTNFSSQSGETRSASGGGSETHESKVPEEVFTTLATGGPEFRGAVEAIIVRSGQTFVRSGDVWIKAIFRQR